jgi:hypothetical protein
MNEQAKPLTRPLEPAERALLSHLLTPEFKGVEALREQAAQAEAIVPDEFPWFIRLHAPRRPPTTSTGTR